MAASDQIHPEAPKTADLDKCVHCGLCLNACPTYRELGVEMDSPRGRIYQMVQVVQHNAPITQEYVDHMDLCLACRGCETACPSGVPYGRLIEAARTHLDAVLPKPFYVKLLRWFVFDHLLHKRWMMSLMGAGLFLYQASGLQKFVRGTGMLKWFPGRLAQLEQLTPRAEAPFFFSQIGKVFPAEGPQRKKVAFLAGCIANVCFARMNEATVRVLQKNGCQVHLPAEQNCCGALHVHSGLKEQARELARKNIDAVLSGGFDAVLTNAGGCGSTLKEYHELLEEDPAYHDKAKQFVAMMKDVNEFLATLELNPKMGKLPITVTYQDSCHMAHGQKIRKGPRQLLQQIPGLTLKEMPMSDLCCGSAGIYNVVQNEMSSSLLEKKIGYVSQTGAEMVVTGNPGCMLQLEAGTRMHGKGQPVLHVMQVLDMAYSKYEES